MNLLKFFVFGLLVCNTSFAQLSVLRNLNIELVEKDSITSAKLESSLNIFLAQAQDASYTHEYVDSNHRKKFEFFFRKLAGIGKNSNGAFYNPTVLKAYSPDQHTYFITVAFTGISNEKPFVYQITELKAVPYNGHFRFYCLFEDRTADLKKQTFGTVTYYYSDILDKEKALDFSAFKDQLSTWTKTPKNPIRYYCFRSLDELLKAYGFLFSARQCNFLCYDLGFMQQDGDVFVTGTKNENYIAGYLGYYMFYNLPNQDKIYAPFLTGVEVYFGGYGLQYSGMDRLKTLLRNALKKRPAINFLDEFKKGRKSYIERHYYHYVLSALLCEAILEKKNFDALLPIIYAGKKGEHFFTYLKEALNIDASNFHQSIVQLLKQ